MRYSGLRRRLRKNENVQDQHFDCIQILEDLLIVHLILERLDLRCASLNPTTEGIVSRSLLSKMRPTTCIINTSRGGLVDQEALVEALEVSIIHP